MRQIRLKNVNENEEELILIDTILQGDDSVYTKLVDKYKHYAYTIANRIMNSHEDAEEVAQDAFIKAFHGLENFNRDSRFSTWLYRIVFNTAISYKRKKRVRLENIDDNISEMYGAKDIDLTEYSDKIKFIDSALDKMLPADATVINLFYLKEFSLEEIGDITGMRINAVKIKLFRARKRMANELRTMLKSEATSLI